MAMDTTKYRWVAAWAAAMLTTTVLAGCGTQVADGTNAEASSNYSAADVRAEAQRVYESFAGAQDQRDASYVVQTYTRNGPLDECLAQRGYPEWDWSLSRPYASPYDALRPSVWFAEPGDRIYSENEIATRPFAEAEKVMNADDRWPAGFSKTLLECEDSIKPASDTEVENASRPAGSAKLIESWRTALTEAGEKLGGSFDAYFDCMAAADLTVLKANGASYDDLAAVMAGEADKAGPPPAADQDPSTYSDAWKGFLATEDQVLAADTACRSDVCDANIGKVMATITDFSESHADEIAAARKGWDEVVAKAAQLGYHGQVGPLGK